ncbi:helix-turn-helix domain-containing protein [Sediminibacillus terrae]|uniref:helix-turn-helix domain-containing protein n=1 Tax=Sediminibacillus terrae TaxID=1562106 RepID=UPI0012973D35|nr:helix-turn-helix domain-containing protein [Sediminibacillus terrae]
MIGDKINYYRRQRKMTQEDLAQGICSISYLSKVENNKMEPSEEILSLLLRRLDIDIPLENKQTLRVLTEAIFHWYEVLREQDMKAADNQYAGLKSKVKNSTNIEIKLTFAVVEFRYFLLKQDFKQAQNLAEFLHQYQDDLPPKLAYYYHSFNSIYFYLQHDYPQALKFCNKAIDLGNLIAEKIEPEVYYQAALIYSRLAKTPLAMSLAEKALYSFTETGNIKKCISCQIIIGVCLNRLEQPEEARIKFTKALHLARELNFITAQAYLYHNIGMLHSSLHNKPAAIDCFSTSYEIKINHHIKSYLNTVYHLAQEFSSMQENDRALEWIAKGLSNCEKLPADRKDFLMLCILKYQILGDVEQLVHFIHNEAIPFFKKSNLWLQECECNEILGDFYSKAHHYKKSSYYFSESNRLRKMNTI